VQAREPPFYTLKIEKIQSISEIGLLNPITVDREHTLIAGLHRLKATKQLGRTEITEGARKSNGQNVHLIRPGLLSMTPPRN